jgi:hypothetical protein
MKQITHNEARNEVGLCISAYDMNERLNAEQELYKYIAQQEKKDKLLELKNLQISVLKQDKGISHTQYVNLLERINNLEKELEALK